MRPLIKLLSVLTVVVLCLTLCACGKKEPPAITSSDSQSSSENPVSSEAAQEKSEFVINPLTGVASITEEEAEFKPLAVAINNVKVAQPIQAGVSGADIVFETVTEAGITRLLGIFKAPTAEMGNIGSIRSARTVFAELSAMFNAVYVHHGMDETYCRPRVNELNIPRIEISTKVDGERIQNGKAWEHTLYTSGEKLRADIFNKGYNTDNKSEPWLNFSDAKTAASDSAKSVTVKFNNTSVTNFTYDEETGVYTRGSSGKELKDYFTQKTSTFTNVFVLYTGISHYPDNYHTKVSLNGGDGYYVTKGGYEKITWQKTGDRSPLAFKDADGKELTVTPGKSYICIVDKSATNSFTVE